MRSNRWLLWGLNLVLAVLLLAVLAVGRASKLRREQALHTARAAAAEAERLTEANRRSRATLPDPASLEHWQHEAATLEQLRRELAALNARADERLTRPAPPPARPSTPAPVEAAAWTNRGRATVQDAIVTAAWAATRGEVEVLAASLHLTPAGRQVAEDWLAGQSPQARLHAPTPEHLIAVLAARRVRAEQLEFVDPTPPDALAQAWSTRVRLTTSGQPDRFINLISVRSDEGWRLLVPDLLVRQYLDDLKSDA